MGVLQIDMMIYARYLCVMSRIHQRLVENPKSDKEITCKHVDTTITSSILWHLNLLLND